ncbi:hypothetical protein CR513_00496, partial [Mucuna pruriens]
MQPLGILEDVLVQVNEFIFPADFYVLDMEDNGSEGNSALILGRPFFMIAKTKIDVHVVTLSMEFEDTYIEFNIFEALKHPAKDHSTFNLDAIDELMEEYFRLGIGIASLVSFIDKIDVINEYCIELARTDSEILPHTLPFSYSGDVNSEFSRPSQYPELHTSNNNKLEESIIVTLMKAKSDSRIATELKPFPGHLKYAYLGDNQQFPVIIANNLHNDQEEKLLEVLRKHKKVIGWKLVDLLEINLSICMRMPNRLGNNNERWIQLYWTSSKRKLQNYLQPVTFIPSRIAIRMMVIKNRQNKMVLARIQNSWRVCIDDRKLNQATHKDHFFLPFIDQVLQKLARKSHFCFLDDFSSYMQIHIVLVDQHKTTFTCLFGTFAYTRMSFRLCNAPSTFQRCMINIFSDLLEDCMEVFMDDFTVYAESFEACLNNLSKVLHRCINNNLF